MTHDQTATTHLLVREADALGWPAGISLSNSPYAVAYGYDAMITHKADALQRAPVHIRDDAFLLLTANTFIFRKIGPGAGMYRSLTHDILQWKPASTVDGGVAPEIDLRGQ